MNLPVINSHDSWSQLEEVWLGDVYPVRWYDHLAPEHYEALYSITEKTHQDLAALEAVLTKFGVRVRRPVYDNIDDFVNEYDQLIKPDICPRDHFLTVGNSLFVPGDRTTAAWQSIIDEYRSDPNCNIVSSLDYFILNGTNTVKLGQDIVIDLDVFDAELALDPAIFSPYRISTVKHGKHMSNCFAVLRPGLIMANSYWAGYDEKFSAWERIFLNRPIYSDDAVQAMPGTEFNGKFYNIEPSQRSFNSGVLDHAQTHWRNYQQSYFETSCLVINEHNVIMTGNNQNLEHTLRDYGINVHWVPFRCRGFWDGGINRVALDIRRRSEIKDHFSNISI